MNIFIVAYAIFIVTANLIGFLVFKKSRNLYLAALVILISAGVFGAIGVVCAVSVFDVGFAEFFFSNFATYFFYNSFLVLLFALVVSGIKKIKKHW
ncbi:hypothetical protein [Anaerosporobacter sp.]